MLFAIYLFFSVIFLFIIIKKIDVLFLMNTYTKGTYDLSNNIYINLGLSQIMSFTNQTDIGLYQYSQDEDINIVKEGTTGYIRPNIDKTLQLILDLYKIEKMSVYFPSLSELIEINCDTLYPSLKDSTIEELNKLYPESDYYNSLLFTYCETSTTISRYHDDKLTMLAITYQTKKLIDLFTERSYNKYAEINNSDLLYTLYVSPQGLFAYTSHQFYLFKCFSVLLQFISMC